MKDAALPQTTYNVGVDYEVRLLSICAKCIPTTITSTDNVIIWSITQVSELCTNGAPNGAYKKQWL